MTIDRPTLLYITTIPFSMNRFFEGQLRFMKDHGFKVVAVSSPGTMLNEVEAREHVAVHAIPMRREISPVADCIALMKLIRLFLKIRPTIVNASTPKAGLLGMLAASVTLVPVKVLVLHGLLTARRTKGLGILLRMVSRISCLLADSVPAVSNSVAQGMIEQGLCPRSKIKVLCNGSINGIDTGRFDPSGISESALHDLRIKFGLSPGNPVIGYVGRLSPDKGIVELLEAWKLIQASGNDVRLLIIGPLDEVSPASSRVIDAFRNDSRVIMTGFVDHGDLPLYYALMQIFVLPSHREGFPLCVLEAAAMGLPIVATRVPGCVDAVEHGITGTLVPVHDAKALANAVKTYLQNEHLAREHGRAARNRVVRDFQPRRVWEAFRQEYVRLMQKKTHELS